MGLRLWWSGGAAVTNNEHAAILRGLAQAEQSELAGWLESIKRLEAMPLSIAKSPFFRQYKQYAAEATCKVAAFTAGAEALENLEVAKAAFRLIQRNRIGDGGPCEFCGQACICSECTATAALERLEGK